MGTLRYQWRKDGANLAGATNSAYFIVNAQTNDAGGYSVLVSNTVGSLSSSNAVLAIVVPPTLVPGQLTVQPGDSVNLNLTVPIGVRLLVEASPDLVNWEVILDTITSDSSLIVRDSSAAITPGRFYRIRYVLPRLD